MTLQAMKGKRSFYFQKSACYVYTFESNNGSTLSLLVKETSLKSLLSQNENHKPRFIPVCKVNTRRHNPSHSRISPAASIFVFKLQDSRKSCRHGYD